MKAAASPEAPITKNFQEHKVHNVMLRLGMSSPTDMPAENWEYLRCLSTVLCPKA